MRLLIVQAGDYASAWRRFQQGLPSTYRDQKASVDYVASLAPRHQVCTVALER
ncbi:hypothetical protein [uncultured Albimonas sp.]|uniref:hypothetical protein n=1 Tax=uncultured Albimonas sp. TaxID=1331701 RepID=UPI0030ECC59B